MDDENDENNDDEENDKNIKLMLQIKIMIMMEKTIKSKPE